MKTYSVLLLYPDYIAKNCGEKTFYGFVEAINVNEAIVEVQLAAEMSQEEGTVDDREDFRPLLVIEGLHQNINPK